MRLQRSMTQVKEQIKTPEKELNKMEQSNLSDAEFKTLVIRMLKEHSEDLNSIKKIQSEIKGTLTEIKNNLQGNNSRWMKPRIKSIIWNTRKQTNKQANKKQTNQNNKKKKESKNKNKTRIVSAASGTTSSISTFPS